MASDKIPVTTLSEPYRVALLAVSRYLNSPESDGTLWSHRIEEVRGVYPNLGTLRAILPELAANGFLKVFDSAGGEYYQLTVDGLRHCGDLSPSSGGSSGQQPDDQWEPLALDRDSDPAKSAIGATEELLDRVRGENGLAETDPERFGATVWSLQTGLDALKKHMPSRQQIQTLLLTPMRWLSDKFAGAAIGELAKTAIQSLLHWLF